MCFWFHVVSSSFHPLLYVLPEAPIPYRKRRGPTRRIAAGSLVKLAGAFGSFSRHMFSFCTRMGCPRFAECVFGAYGYLGSKFFRQRTEASSTYLYREGWPLHVETTEKPCGIGAVLRAGPTLLQADITRGHSKAATSHIYLYREGWPLSGKCLGNRAGIGDFLRAGPTLLQADITRGHSKAATSHIYLYREGWPLSGKCLGNRAGIGDFLRAGPTLLQADITRGHSKAATSHIYLYREGWPLSGKCLGNRAGIGDFLRAGPTLLQADITRGHSKAATSQETNENRRITRIEELTIVPTLATYPRLVSFVSSGESDAPAATVWVLKRSDRGSVRRYMEKMTGLSRAQTRLITEYLPGTRGGHRLAGGRG